MHGNKYNATDNYLTVRLKKKNRSLSPPSTLCVPLPSLRTLLRYCRCVREEIVSYGLIIGEASCILTLFFSRKKNSMFIQYRITYTNNPTDKQAHSIDTHIFQNKKRANNCCTCFDCCCGGCWWSCFWCYCSATADVVCSLKEECTLYSRSNEPSTNKLASTTSREGVCVCVITYFIIETN